MQVYYDRDTNPDLIRMRRVAVLGFGSQGHAHALNLRDSGVKEIAVGGREGKSSERAREAGFNVVSTPEAAAWADVIMMGAPDESQPGIYKCDLAPHMKQGAAPFFAHGFAIHFHLIEPRADLDIVMVAPKAQGHAMRREYLRGGGVPGLIAIQQDASGTARDLALSYASAIGNGRAGIMETTFREECETDLFSEQAVLCGGLVELIRAGFEEALRFHLDGMLEDGAELPSPSDLDSIPSDPAVTEVARILVRTDVPATNAVHLDVTLPEDLVRRIDAAAGNRSRFLADAAERALAGTHARRRRARG